MNKYNIKWMVGVMCAVALATSAFSADTSSTAAAANTVATAKVSKSVQPVQRESLFNAGEFGVSVASAYDVGKASEVNGFNQPYTLNLNAGVFWFPFRNFGAEVNVPFYQSKGVSVEEVQFGLVARFPLSKTVSVLRNVSPYLGVDAVYGWDAVQEWSYLAKVGVETRVSKKVGFFVEGQYRNNEVDNWAQGAVSVNGGLRLVL